MAAQSGDPRKKGTKKTGTAPRPDTSSGPTSASSWVSKTAGADEDLLLPSGNIARVRRVGPEAFLTQGLMPDTVTPIVEKAINSKKGLRPQDQAKMAQNPKQLGAVMEMLDRTLVYAVVEPRVVMPPVCVVCHEADSVDVEAHVEPGTEDEDHHVFVPEDRDPDLLYADRVDLDDKMFIMNFVAGGTRDLERFRSEFGAGMASVSALEGSEGSTV